MTQNTFKIGDRVQVEDTIFCGTIIALKNKKGYYLVEFDRDHSWAANEDGKHLIPSDTPPPDPGYTTPTHAIEHRYGVQPGDDWLAVYHASPFKIGDRVIFENPASKGPKYGRVVNILYSEKGLHDGYIIDVLYDHKPIPRRTHPKWLTLAPVGTSNEASATAAARDELNGLGASDLSFDPPADFDPVATATGAPNTGALDDEFESGEDLLYHEINVLKSQLEKLATELAHQMEVAQQAVKDRDLARMKQHHTAKALEKAERRNKVATPNELSDAHARIKELEAQLAAQGEKKKDAAQPAILTLQQQWDINQAEAIKEADAEIDRYRAEYELFDIGWNITTKQVARCVVLQRKTERATIITDSRDPIRRTANGRIDRSAMNQQALEKGEQAVARYDQGPQPVATVVAGLLKEHAS